MTFMLFRYKHFDGFGAQLVSGFKIHSWAHKMIAFFKKLATVQTKPSLEPEQHSYCTNDQAL